MATATERRRTVRALSQSALLAFAVVGSANALAADFDAAGAPPATVNPAAAAATDVKSANAAATDANARPRVREWLIVPNISVRGTATDNVDLTGSEFRKGDFVTEVIPGIRIDGNGARVKLHLDYRMDNVLYARDPSKNNLQNALDATGNVEAIEKFLFIDGRASITQEAVSAFGPRPTDATSNTANRTEARAFQLSPYIQGRLGSAADYQARYSIIDLRSSSDVAGDSRVGEFTAFLNGTTRLSSVDWRVEASSLTDDSQQRRDTRADRARGIVIYKIDPQFRLSATAGRERNDYETFDTVDKTTYGAGFEWAPTPRTNIHGNWEERFFGTGWDVGARHRTPYLAFDLSDKRDINTDAQRAAGLSYGAAYGLLFAALTTRIPDPIARASETQQLLQHGGIPADLNLPPDFLAGDVFLERRQQASMAVLGVRNTLTFIVYRLSRDLLGATASSIAPNQAVNTLERGATTNFSHRLSGYSSISAIASWLRTTGESTVNLASEQFSTHLIYVTQLGPRTSGSLELRHVRFNSNATGTSDYRENALIASLLVQF